MQSVRVITVTWVHARCVVVDLAWNGRGGGWCLGGLGDNNISTIGWSLYILPYKLKLEERD